jgi:hypothetical protein
VKCRVELFLVAVRCLHIYDSFFSPLLLRLLSELHFMRFIFNTSSEFAQQKKTISAHGCAEIPREIISSLATKTNPREPSAPISFKTIISLLIIFLALPTYTELKTELRLFFISLYIFFLSRIPLYAGVFRRSFLRRFYFYSIPRP